MSLFFTQTLDNVYNANVTTTDEGELITTDDGEVITIDGE